MVLAGYIGFDRDPPRADAEFLQPPAGAPVDDRPDLDRLIGVYEEKTATSRDPLDHRTMGRLYLAKADLTDDLDAYRSARIAFGEARRLFPDDTESISLEARAAFALHDFEAAGELIDSWLTLDPDSLDAIALAGDVSLAVGDIPAASAAYDSLATNIPAHPALQARLAQLAAATGDLTAALSHATIAESTARDTGHAGRALGWYQSFLGQLAFDTGDYPRSEEMFSEALDNSPMSAHDQAGVGRALAAQGDLFGAIEYLTLATSGSLPAVDDLGYLADLFEVAGDNARATEARARIEEQLQSGTLDTTVHARLAAIYFLDHDLHVDLALSMAEADLAKRQDAGAWDAYGWALHKNGRNTEALVASEKALAGGIQDAGFFYRAAVIRQASDDLSGATDLLERALALSPRFHPVNADAAERLLTELR